MIKGLNVYILQNQIFSMELITKAVHLREGEAKGDRKVSLLSLIPSVVKVEKELRIGYF
jgi:hypothetical protein